MKLTTLCYIEQEDSYLMLYRNKKENDENAGKWIGVGGKLESHENPFDCAMREVYEETGLTLKRFSLRGIINFESDIYENEVMYLFTATEFEGEITPNCSEGELRWIKKDGIMDLSMWEGDRIFLEKLLNDEENILLTLSYKGDTLVSSNKSCILCPRNCGANRSIGELGMCHVDDKICIARASLHLWEEPCISGDKGSGTVFFSGCNLGCVFCQNCKISRGEVGVHVGTDDLVRIFLKLQEMGANNINLVTATHYAIPVSNALRLAREQGLHIPVVYNTSAYEKVETLRLFCGLVDIYLPDFKYMSAELSREYSAASDYPEIAKAAILEMANQVGEVDINESGMMTKGVIVRHLQLPDGICDSKRVLKYLHDTYGDRILISIMNQYTPVGTSNYPELDRKITDEEYENLIDYAVDIGIENAFVQDGETAEESFIPDFESFDLSKFLER